MAHRVAMLEASRARGGAGRAPEGGTREAAAAAAEASRPPAKVHGRSDGARLPPYALGTWRARRRPPSPQGGGSRPSAQPAPAVEAEPATLGRAENTHKATGARASCTEARAPSRCEKYDATLTVLDVNCVRVNVAPGSCSSARCTSTRARLCPQSWSRSHKLDAGGV